MMTGKFFSFRALLLALTAILAVSASAQVTVKGTVVDQDDEPIIGASVLEEGTAQGTSTDIDGNFTLRAYSDSHHSSWGGISPLGVTSV